MLRYNKNLITRFTSNKQREAYYYYLIATEHFYLKSGKFSLNEFMDLLQESYNQNTLHHLPGNNRAKFREKLFTLLSESYLFKYLKAENKFRTVSIKKLSPDKTLQRPVKPEDLQSKRIFNDILIGIILDGNQKSVKTAAEQTGFTERRIQQAIKRNHESGRFIRTHNYIIDMSTPATYKAIQSQRRDLLYYHGINTPEPVKMVYRGSEAFYLAIYSANSYSYGDSQSLKSSDYLKRCKNNRLKPVSEKEAAHFRTEARLWEFTSQYSFNDYLEEHGFNRVCSFAA